MYFVYVLESETSGRLYIGSTDHLIRRFHEHRRGKTRSTRHHGPWFMPYYETRPTRAEAVRRKMQIRVFSASTSHGGEDVNKEIKGVAATIANALTLRVSSRSECDYGTCGPVIMPFASF